MASKNLVAVDFEVFGKVQGVHFRKYTQEQGKMLGIKGWCMNTDRGTVVGRLEGPPDKILKIKNWLRNTGSPKSRIDKTEFTNEKVITKHFYTDFTIKKIYPS